MLCSNLEQEKEIAMSRFASVFVFTMFMAGMTGCMADPGADPSAGSTEQGITGQAFTAAGHQVTFRTAESGVIANSVTFPGGTGCRRVTASSIPLFSTAAGSTVVCRFLQGDQFIIAALSNDNGGRGLSWCNRGTSPDNGIFSWASLAGTVDC
jgi:hypothetical protein